MLNEEGGIDPLEFRYLRDGRPRQHDRHGLARPDGRLRAVPHAQVRSDSASRLLPVHGVLEQRRRAGNGRAEARRRGPACRHRGADRRGRGRFAESLSARGRLSLARRVVGQRDLGGGAQSRAARRQLPRLGHRPRARHLHAAARQRRAADLGGAHRSPDRSSTAQARARPHAAWQLRVERDRGQPPRHAIRETAPRSMAIASATADFSQDGFPPEHAIDANSKTGWAIQGPEPWNVPRTAVFRWQDPWSGSGPTRWTIRLDQEYGGHHTLGRFRVRLGEPFGRSTSAGSPPPG